MENKPSEKALLESLKQNWEHIRHIENERFQFTYIYSILVTGVLAFLGKNGFSTHVYLIIFLILLSIFGLLITLKVGLEFNNHMTKIKNIVEELSLNNYMGLPTSYKGIGKIIKVRHTFVAFYLTMCLIWLYLLILELVVKKQGL